jgi:hypothetical protein
MQYMPYGLCSKFRKGIIKKSGEVAKQVRQYQKSLKKDGKPFFRQKEKLNDLSGTEQIKM